jgi:2'-hydroxyisoflavone reductase
MAGAGPHDGLMRLLILGGTWFLGRALAELALSEGWPVTTFSRGLTGRDVPGTERVRGDRARVADIRALAGKGPWDAVVDTSGYLPEAVDLAARELRQAAARYVYISTVHAYRGWPEEPLTDESPLWGVVPERAALAGGVTQGVAPSLRYGQLKAECERVARRCFGDRDCLILRPGIILGPYEYVGRLPCLLRRMRCGGKVLAAGHPGRPIQPVDVRDLAAFILHAIAGRLGGAMNVTATAGHATYGELLGACRAVTGADAELVWVEDEWLARQDVTPWTEIPLWRPNAAGWNVTSARARAAGLCCRPLTQTVADTWAWMGRESPMPHQRSSDIGVDPVKEQRLLSAWASRPQAVRSG